MTKKQIGIMMVMGVMVGAASAGIVLEAQVPGMPGRVSDRELDRRTQLVSDGVYRVIDREFGNVCYYRAGELSCVTMNRGR